MTELENEIAELIVEAVALDQPASSIDPDAPLYGDALGLDSIDILEIAVVVAKRYGIEMHSEDAGNAKIFSSLRALAHHVSENRTQ
jgi:acyl carrier protein